MLTGMAFVAVADMTLYGTIIVVSLNVLPQPWKYIVAIVASLATLAKVIWLYHIIGEIYASMPPKRRPHKRAAKTRHYSIWALIILEALICTVLYLLNKSGIKVSIPMIISAMTIAGLLPLLF